MSEQKERREQCAAEFPRTFGSKSRRSTPAASERAMTSKAHAYEVRPRKDHRDVDLISDALPFGRLWYGKPNAINNAIGYAKFFSRSHHALIRVFDETGNRDRNAGASGRFQRAVAALDSRFLNAE